MSETMKAMVYLGPGKKEVLERPKPTPQNSKAAVVKMLKTTICGTDLHILKGDTPEVEEGRVLGHEGIGIVESVGENVSNFKVGDKVKILAGKDKGKEGKVLAVNVKDNTVLVENVNMVTKHTKPSAANQNGGIVTKEAPLHISNVMLMADGKATRVGFKMDGDKKVRVAKATGKVID